MAGQEYLGRFANTSEDAEALAWRAWDAQVQADIAAIAVTNRLLADDSRPNLQYATAFIAGLPDVRDL